MPKYLIQGSYSPDGLKGLQKDKASGRKAALSQAVEGLGGKLDSIYYALGEHDAIAIVDLPDTVSAASLALTISASGLVHTKTTALLTIEEADKALAKSVNYKAPGR